MEPKQQTGIDAIEAPAPIELCNGLGIISPRKYNVGDEYTLEIVLNNLSQENITIWVPDNKIDIHITDYNFDGETVTYFAPEFISAHNMFINQAWQNNLFSLKPNESRIFKKRIGRNVPGKMQFIAIYSSHNEEVTMMRYMGRNKNYKPEITMEENEQKVQLWIGKLVSTPVVVEFVKDS